MRDYDCYRPRILREIMMNTPICDFVAQYIRRESMRLHMPGHKGVAVLGCEPWDITEIPGADSLYEAKGIIRESEKNAGALFGARTFYSTEGSSQVIRAMVRLACLYAEDQGKKPLIWAGRNAHSAFLSAAALMDCTVEWLYSTEKNSYLSCMLNAIDLEQAFCTAEQSPTAVYVTSPDYLGNQLDIAALAGVCHTHGTLLLVDNAHGAYLKFLPDSCHPMDLGADLCCDSAHKTLPVLTGGAYLHLSHTGPAFSYGTVKEALRLFGSTSPSYLILQSLDAANRYLADVFPADLLQFLPQVEAMKQRLADHGYRLSGTEPLKLTICARPYGYDGTELAELLSKFNIVVEFSDPDFVVFMLTPRLDLDCMKQLTELLMSVPRRKKMSQNNPDLNKPRKIMDIRKAMLAPSETLSVDQCCGRVLAQASVGCPPAVPIIVSGELIDEGIIQCFQYYGITSCSVVSTSILQM